MKLSGNTVLITGGATGIGFAMSSPVPLTTLSTTGSVTATRFQVVLCRDHGLHGEQRARVPDGGLGGER